MVGAGVEASEFSISTTRGMGGMYVTMAVVGSKGEGGEDEVVEECSEMG